MRSFDTSPAKRYAALMAGEFEATVLQEPWITVAEKAGCRLVSTTFFYGTWVADATLDADTYAAFVGPARQQCNASMRTSGAIYTTSRANIRAILKWRCSPG